MEHVRDTLPPHVAVDVAWVDSFIPRMNRSPQATHREPGRLLHPARDRAPHGDRPHTVRRIPRAPRGSSDTPTENHPLDRTPTAQPPHHRNPASVIDAVSGRAGHRSPRRVLPPRVDSFIPRMNKSPRATHREPGRLLHPTHEQIAPRRPPASPVREQIAPRRRRDGPRRPHAHAATNTPRPTRTIRHTPKRHPPRPHPNRATTTAPNPPHPSSMPLSRAETTHAQ